MPVACTVSEQVAFSRSVAAAVVRSITKWAKQELEPKLRKTLEHNGTIITTTKETKSELANMKPKTKEKDLYKKKLLKANPKKRDFSN